MKTWKAVFIVFGIFLVLSVISGMAYLCKPKENAPNMQSDGVGWVERRETQQSNPKLVLDFVRGSKTCSQLRLGIQNLSPTSIGDPKLDKEEFAQKTRKLQMPFIANKGQVDEQVEFYAKTFGGTVFVTKDGEIVYALPNNSSDVESECRLGEAERTQQAANPQSGNTVFRDRGALSVNNRELDTHPELASSKRNPKSAIQNPKSGVALREEFVGARVKTIQGEQPSVTKVNYFKGNDPSKWKTNVSTYDVVSLGDVYDGIELKLKAYGNNVEKLFCVKPKSNPDQIKVQISGAKSITVNEEGQLEVETELGHVKFTKPIAYQEIDGKRVEVAVEYRIQESGDRSQKTDVGWMKRSAPNKNGLNGLNRLDGIDGFASLNPSYPLNQSNQLNISPSPNPNSEVQNLSSTQTCPRLREGIGGPKSQYGFKVASYDRTKPLIIDPLLASTFLGGSEYDWGASLTIDTSGNVYVTGNTWSTDFPTTSGAYDTSYNGGADVFVSKLDGGLTSLLASTYLGGSKWDSDWSLILDTSGNVYVAGQTMSTDFPTTSGAYDTSFNGGDVFVSKLNGGLTSLLASTYLGGSDYDWGASLTIDTSGHVYVTGETGSTDFPTTSGAYDTSFNGGGDFPTDIFVSKLDGGLTSLLASTYLGGSDRDSGRSLTLDTSGNVYVTGHTASSDFPTTSGAYDTSFNGGGDFPTDIFVSKLDGGLTSLLASTYLGGSKWDSGYSLTLDTSGNVYVAGQTMSTDFPTTSGAYDTVHNGGSDVFVSKLDGGLTSLLASTYLGGSDYDWGASLTLDTSGNVYVAGQTMSTDFPTTSGAYDTSFNGGGDDFPTDIFVSKLDGGLTSLLASTYLGGSDRDSGRSLTIDTSEHVYVTGDTWSTDFPTTSGAYDTSHNGGDFDVIVSKLDGNLSASTTTPTPTPATTPSPSPTPTSGCEVGEIMLSESKLTLNVGKSKDVTVTLTGKDGCIPDGVTIKTEINTAGRKRISVSPENVRANDSGEATFTITAKKKGIALLTFKSDGMKKKLMVKVKK